MQLLPKDILKFKRSGNRSEHWMSKTKDESWLSKYRTGSFDNGGIFQHNGFSPTLMGSWDSSNPYTATSSFAPSTSYGGSFRIV